jgi:hypothetical protein
MPPTAADTAANGTRPVQLKRILLTLARSKEHPDGSSRHGYEIVAPLDAGGRLDPLAWKHARQSCKVRRFWAGEPDDIGHLVHRPGGAGGATWTFDYDETTLDDDEAGFRLGEHVLTPGEYVSVRDDEVWHTFKVEWVKDA